mgnify:CR=1 FL=1
MSDKSMNKRLVLAAVAASALLAGCGAEQEELTQWMEQQRREAKPNVTPLTPPKTGRAPR